MDVCPMPVFSLPMYDWPQVRAATDAWAHGIARHLRGHGFAEAPLELIRQDEYQQLWNAPDLLLSQSCGYPLTHEYEKALVPVITPHYSVEGCSGPAFSSFIFVRAADSVGSLPDLRGRTCVYNDRTSMSGMLALKLLFAPHAASGDFFSRAIESGSHVKSLEAVQRGIADVCSIDAICVGLARRYRPELLSGLIEIARSPLVPGLPYVTSAACSSDKLRQLRRALAAAFDDPDLREAREALFLSGHSILDRNDYTIIANLEREVKRRGDLILWKAA
jgi:ABC-type phosphate/phosphonate transport system substrate-binding protein